MGERTAQLFMSARQRQKLSVGRLAERITLPATGKSPARTTLSTFENPTAHAFPSAKNLPAYLHAYNISAADFLHAFEDDVFAYYRKKGEMKVQRYRTEAVAALREATRSKSAAAPQ